MMMNPDLGPAARDCRMVYVSSDPGIIAPENPTDRADKNKGTIFLPSCRTACILGIWPMIALWKHKVNWPTSFLDNGTDFLTIILTAYLPVRSPPIGAKRLVNKAKSRSDRDSIADHDRMLISMIGAIIGDVIGSVYKWHNVKTTEFQLFSGGSAFTDDTVMTVAVADALLNKHTYKNPIKNALESRIAYIAKLKQYGHRYPDVGYGSMFHDWLKADNPKPYNSYGNGSAMRVSPVGYAFDTLEAVLKEARRSAKVTHNHRDGIRGAQAVAAAVFLANQNESKDSIKRRLEAMFGYNLSRRLDEIRPKYEFDSSCQGSVPEAIIAFLESEHFEDAIRKAVSLGGDSDTIACITGAIAQAYYKRIPAEMMDGTLFRLDAGMKTIIRQFNEKYKVPY